MSGRTGSGGVRGWLQSSWPPKNDARHTQPSLEARKRKRRAAGKVAKFARRRNRA